MTPVPVLLYHSVDDDPAPEVARWTVTPRTFAEHMAVVRDGGWRAVTFTELVDMLAAGASTDRVVAITFDDGFEDVLTRALPAMAGMVGTAYVTSGYLRDAVGDAVPAPGRMLTAAQLGEIRSAGWEVGVHGHRHVALDAVSRAAAAVDIVTSKQRVEDALGSATSSFAYPYGYHDRRVQDLVREAGFRCAAAVKNAHSHERDDLWGVARITVERDMGAAWLERRLSQASPPTAPSRERLVTTGWRAARRARAVLTGVA